MFCVVAVAAAAAAAAVCRLPHATVAHFFCKWPAINVVVVGAELVYDCTRCRVEFFRLPALPEVERN